MLTRRSIRIIMFRYQLMLMSLIAFIIVFGLGGLYNEVSKEIAIHCQEGC